MRVFKAKVGILVIVCMVLAGVVLIPSLNIWRRNAICETGTITNRWGPSFSSESGYYREPFMLEIKPEFGGEIYYTLDGSEPDCTKIKYMSPILISDPSKQSNVWSAYDNLSNQWYYIPEEPVAKCVVVRAAEYQGNERIGNSNTAIYFIGKEIEQYFSIPNIAITTDPAELFDYERGIMVLGKTYDDWVDTLGDEELEKLPEREDYKILANFRNRGNEWERKVDWQYFEEGKLVWKQEVGIRNRGNGGSRGPAKCFNVYARAKYDGNSKMIFSPFKTYRKADTLALRNKDTILHDGLIINMLNDRPLLSYNYQPINLFLNGEYWGLYNLTERYDRQYFEDYYNVKKDYVIIHKHTEFEAKTEKMERYGSEEWEFIYNFVNNNDLALQENFDVIASLIDLDSFIDYYCVQIFIESGDCSEDYNVLQWKSAVRDERNRYMDGKWRWALYDIDNSLDEVEKDSLNDEIREGRPAFGEHVLLKALLANDAFRQDFINTMMDLMNKNFRSENVLPQLWEQAEAISNSAVLHNDRYRNTENYINKFYKEIYEMENFFVERPVYVVDMFQEKFNLEEPVTIELYCENDGESYIQLNSIKVDDRIWTGNYFTEIPVKVSAVVSDDETFEKWRITCGGITKENKNQSIVIFPKNGMQIEAVYQRKS